jgi:hypothetical protein
MGKSLREFLSDRTEERQQQALAGNPVEGQTHLGPRVTRPFAQPITSGSFRPWASDNAAGGVSGFSRKGR